MAKQAERRAQTRAELLRRARKLFLKHGYEATTTQMILEASGLSKGAMYYHFASKTEIMAALYEATSSDAIAAAMAQVSDGAGHLDRLKQAALAWLAEVRKPETARILFDLGPKALGWRKAKEIEDENSLRALTASLQAAKDAGEADIASPEITARMLNALLAEAALLDLESAGSRQTVTETLEKFLDGL